MSGPRPTSDPGRVVVVAAGFALWAGGRCVAAARWSDVRRLRAYYRDVPASGRLCLGVELVDGSVMELREEAPGFDAFLNRGSATLQGLLAPDAWRAALGTAPREDGVVLFERERRRYDRGR